MFMDRLNSKFKLMLRPVAYVRTLPRAVVQWESNAVSVVAVGLPQSLGRTVTCSRLWAAVPSGREPNRAVGFVTTTGVVSERFSANHRPFHGLETHTSLLTGG